METFGFPGGASGKEPNAGDVREFLGREDPLEKGMATHSNIPAWEIRRTEEHGRPQSIGLHRAGHY